ncbi:hypothetical protein PAPYR_13004 [Paratrimastix pyriformis]|uniref:Uncharacterized protein n=1 Tax=Paratrimastix pyriformis TaxID=342808 RepID=A0ABQ8U0Y6_9EUKA|nr:hypothetical protein PAPYR_13004 [Paratrimastix pyriformis]
MSAHPLFHPSFIPTHLLNRSTIKFQLAWHARPSKSPQAYIITCNHDIRASLPFQTSLSQEHCRNSKESTRQTATRKTFAQTYAPDVASLCRIPIPGIVLHPTIEVFPKVGVLLCSFPHEVVPFGGVFLLLEVVPLGFSSFLSQCRPAMPLEVVPDGGVFLLLEVVPIGVFLVPLGEVCLPHFSQVVLDPLSGHPRGNDP